MEYLSHRSGISRAAAFEEWLTAMVCALAAETKGGEYLAMVERHKAGKVGHRGIDLMDRMFGELVNAMRETDADVLGDLFQGAITYGEARQYFMPECVTWLLAQMSIDPDARPTDGKSSIAAKNRASFCDVPPTHPHAAAITLAYVHGIIDGDTDAQPNSIGTFRPDEQINRAEVAKMLALASKLLTKERPTPGIPFSG